MWIPVPLCVSGQFPKCFAANAAMSTHHDLISTLGPCCNKEAKNGFFLAHLMGKHCLKAACIRSAILFLWCFKREVVMLFLSR